MNTPTRIIIHTELGTLTLPAPCSLEAALPQIVSHRDIGTSQVATAVNGVFVARNLRAQHWLNDGDTVLCFAPITGG